MPKSLGKSDIYELKKEEGKMNNNRIIGNHGEEFASRILEADGYKVLERNYWTRLGEVDIIASKNQCLHFVEVKTRTQTRYGMPAESITEEKKRHMRRVAQIYMSNSRMFWRNISFDVIEVSMHLIPNCI